MESTVQNNLKDFHRSVHIKREFVWPHYEMHRACGQLLREFNFRALRSDNCTCKLRVELSCKLPIVVVKAASAEVRTGGAREVTSRTPPTAGETTMSGAVGSTSGTV